MVRSSPKIEIKFLREHSVCIKLAEKSDNKYNDDLMIEFDSDTLKAK